MKGKRHVIKYIKKRGASLVLGSTM